MAQRAAEARQAVSPGSPESSASDHRESVSLPLPTPSVIESPMATTAFTGRGTSTSTPVRTIQEPILVVKAAPPSSFEASPGSER